MREKSIMDNLSCKMQAHVRVCKENKLEGKNYCLLIERLTVRYYVEKVKKLISVWLLVMMLIA